MLPYRKIQIDKCGRYEGNKNASLGICCSKNRHRQDPLIDADISQ